MVVSTETIMTNKLVPLVMDPGSPKNITEMKKLLKRAKTSNKTCSKM